MLLTCIIFLFESTEIYPGHSVSPEGSREELLTALTRGLCEYQWEHLNEIALDAPLKDTIYAAGGAALLDVKYMKEY